jgi:hypothetical protein
MGLQRQLVAMLGDTFTVERAAADELILTPDGGDADVHVRLLAPEASLADYVASNAADGLAAVDDVGGDGSGATAALSLLSVHIEEELLSAGGESVSLLRVGADGLDVQRIG